MCEHQLGQPVLCCPAQVPTSVGVWGELLPHLILSLGPVGAAIPLQGVHPAPVACGMSAFGQLDGPPCRTQHWLLPIPPHPLSLLPPPCSLTQPIADDIVGTCTQPLASLISQ